MTTDPYVTACFFASILLLLCGLMALAEWIDVRRARKAASRQLRRRIGRYGWPA